ncbi:hypothetical protein STRIP9103_05450, partial [Streptomyces ipomoeae 91-03]
MGRGRAGASARRQVPYGPG